MVSNYNKCGIYTAGIHHYTQWYTWVYTAVYTGIHKYKPVYTGITGPILTFTASGHLPERPHFYLSHFLLHDSCKFPSNFLVQYRAEFPIEFTLSLAIHVALTFPGITHMMNYLDFLWYFKPQKKSRKFKLSLSFLIHMQMTFHAHVLSAVLMRFWGVACVLNGHALYTIFPTPHFLALYNINTSTYKVSY